MRRQIEKIFKKNQALSVLNSEEKLSNKFFTILNISIPFLMGVYVFTNPLSLSALNEFAYYLSFLSLIILLVFKKVDFTLRSPLTVGIALFFLWAVLGLFITLDFSNTLHDLRGYLLEYLIVFYLLINFYTSRHRLETLSVLVITSAMTFAIGGIILYYFIEGHHFHERFGRTFKEMYTGFMCFTTVFAATLSLHKVYTAESKARQLIYFFSFLILSAATLLNQSRGAIISLFVSLIIMCIYKKKSLIFITGIIFMLLLLPGVKERITELGMTSVRSQMFFLSLEVIKDYPIAGVGYGGEIYGNKKLVDLEKYNAKLPEKYQQKPEIVASTHNTFLDIAVRTGLVGLALFILIILTAVWMLWDIFRQRQDTFFRSWPICLFACLTGYLIQADFNDSLYGTQGVLLYIILAMIAILWNLRRIEMNSSVQT